MTIADHTRDASMPAIASRILTAAPPSFALVGLSMGGYIAFEILRQAPDRVARLALLDTTARPDTPEQTQRRQAQIALARGGRFAEVLDLLFPVLIHRNRQNDVVLGRLVHLMADDIGPEAFIRQQQAIMGRPDSRPRPAGIGCPTLVLVDDGDELIPPDRSAEIASGIQGARLVMVPDCGHLSTL